MEIPNSALELKNWVVVKADGKAGFEGRVVKLDDKEFSVDNEVTTPNGHEVRRFARTAKVIVDRKS